MDAYQVALLWTQATPAGAAQVVLPLRPPEAVCDLYRLIHPELGSTHAPTSEFARLLAQGWTHPADAP